jgi:hypothetical protein
MDPAGFELAGPTRLELATSGVTGRRSNQLNYEPAEALLAPRGERGGTAVRGLGTSLPAGIAVAPERNGRCWVRTSDPLRVRQVLYRLS